MPKYRADFYGRLKNAIGIFYSITAYVEAEDEKAANLKLYDTYDNVLMLKIRLVGVPAMNAKPEPEAFCQRTLAIYKSGVPMGTHCTYAWSGKMPCTGILRCTMCGKEKS